LLEAALIVLCHHGSNNVVELARLKRELARVTKERDFLRDAAAYFAKELSSGTQ